MLKYNFICDKINFCIGRKSDKCHLKIKKNEILIKINIIDNNLIHEGIVINFEDMNQIKTFIMKKKFTFPLFLSILVVLAMSSCVKEGPQGPQGEPGIDGINGTNGVDGQDGTAGCVQCHDDSQTILAKSVQWESSVHATGGNFERNTEECAPCHTSQGFLERIASGLQETAAPVENPAPQNCYTCHNIHETYTPDDWARTTSAPVTLWINSEVVDFGEGNLCANCHQPRIPDPMPVIGGDSVNVTSPYWGLHHGPQAAILAGTGGFEVGTGYSNSMHTTLVTDGCVTCHMAEPYGAQAGGHNMGMAYEYHGSERINTTGCVTCHDAAAINDLIAATQEEVVGLLDSLHSVLEAKGALDADGGIIPGMMSAEVAGAVMNYKMVEEDRSEGVHNANYVKALLENSIDAVNQ